MWIEYGEIDFVAKEVTYNAKCKREYNTPSEKQSSSTIDSVMLVYMLILQNQSFKIKDKCPPKSSYQRTVFDVKSEIPAKRTRSTPTLVAP